jgi:hypothetical protein
MPQAEIKPLPPKVRREDGHWAATRCVWQRTSSMSTAMTGAEGDAVSWATESRTCVAMRAGVVEDERKK